jgi:serine/threonine-protein kinase
MPLGPGARLGPYEIVAAIGAGGMGEVYRATDTNLGRQVAIKILPDAFAQDPERVARFEREAKTLASLNHPHIAIIHGVEKSQGTYALVMELIEGEDLSQRIARGPIPIDEALPLAKQIAEALEAAHEQGIIHRDLKPANIKVREDGTVKVLDFGLAKLMGPAVAGPYVPKAVAAGFSRPDASVSPTITSPAMMTGVGVLLGTAAYMSPEQAKGRAADKRSDIWAFGCVLYEMITGKRCFDGEDVADTLAFVLTKEPGWDALPSSTPPSIATLLRRCLDKDRRKRIGDVAAALFAIDEVAAPGTVTRTSTPAITARQVPLWRRLATYGALVLVAGAIAGSGVWVATRPAPPRVSRLAITTTPPTALTINGGDRDLAITSDGSRIVFVGNDGTELFVRRIDALEPQSLFRGAPRAPFVSPDGEWVGFTDGYTVLKKVAITGGPATTIATLDGYSRGATWTTDDTIVFATNTPTTGLQQVPAAGGPITVLTRPDRTRGDLDHLWPELLPTGRAILFTILPAGSALEAAQIAVFDRETGAQTVVFRGGTHAHYVNSGHLVYAAANTLRAVAFDPLTLATRGPPVSVVPELQTNLSGVGGVDAVIATDGTLGYIRGGSAGERRSLAWVDRQGREVPIAAPSRLYDYPRVSPDGRRIVVRANDQESDLWVWDVARLTLTRLTFTPGTDIFPLWTPDGRRLLYSSEREGARNLFWQAADGTGAVERLTQSPNTQNATGVSPDGAHLFFTEVSPKTGEDVMQVEVTGGAHRVTALVQSSFAERNAVVSPDGRWLAYEANDSGQLEVYVRPYPEVSTGRWQVSTGGGTRPLWSRTGRELFYVSPAGAILRVGVEQAPSWPATTPTMVVKEGYATNPVAIVGRSYDISPDGRRFLVLKPSSDPNAAPPQLVVVQHFDEELRRLVPTK